MANPPDRQYGVIISDLYSSASVPMHLLTKKALMLYCSKPAPRGIIAFHISSNFYNLAQLFRVLLNTLCVESCLVPDPAKKPSVVYGLPFIRGVMSRSFTDGQKEVVRKPGREPLYPIPGGVWTDQYSNILPYLK